MAVKRSLVDESDGNPEFQQRNQRFKFTKCLYKDEGLQSFSAHLENLLRKVVQEEIDRALLRHFQSVPRSLPNEAKLRKFKLQFEGQLRHRLYTGNNIEAVGTSPLKVVLVDALSGQLVTDDPLSSAKIEIVALHGHFKVEDWTQKEFNDNLVPARDGKRPLLVGERVIALCNGVAFINRVCITDNSSWERSKMFRLGAMIMSKQDQVKEAVTSPFEVKDRRGETYQKHTTLSLEDEVWRLKGIAKDGKLCKRLANYQIFKVRDFLQTYRIDQSLLRNVLRVRPKLWETLVQQVAFCFSTNVSTNFSALEPSRVCSELVGGNTISGLHQSCAPGTSQVQPETQLTYTQGMGLNREPDEYMVINRDTSSIDNNPLVDDSLAKSSNDNEDWLTQGYMPPSPSTGLFYANDIYNFHTSNLV